MEPAEKVTEDAVSTPRAFTRVNSRKSGPNTPIKSPGYSPNKRWDFDKVNTIIERADNILQERRQHLEQWMQHPFYYKRDSDQEVDALFRELDKELEILKKEVGQVVPDTTDMQHTLAMQALGEVKKQNDRYKSILREYNAFRNKCSSTMGWNKDESSECPCGGIYKDNGAHLLSDYLIKSDQLCRFPANCVCCPAGRPIRPKEMQKALFVDEIKLKLQDDEQLEGTFFVYCEGDGRAHVYMGSKDECVHGNGVTAENLRFKTVKLYQTITSRPGWKWPEGV
ncbi:hypothetical protein Ddc_12235 [Ditylenchus destructor]|nr:hypothetical protein Ddc_12235 [Ditylenchus destructor]